MREIKFRAWDGIRMLDTIRLTAAHGIRLVSSSDLARHDVSDDAYVFMQSTGLKDKNGKECFEGDKVKNRLTDHYGTVVYTDEFAAFNVVDEKRKWVCSMGAMGSDGFEITGNIYEG